MTFWLGGQIRSALTWPAAASTIAHATIAAQYRLAVVLGGAEREAEGMIPWRRLTSRSRLAAQAILETGAPLHGKRRSLRTAAGDPERFAAAEAVTLQPCALDPRPAAADESASDNERSQLLVPRPRNPQVARSFHLEDPRHLPECSLRPTE